MSIDWSTITELACTGILAFFASLAITPIVRRVACYLGIVDKPDAHRKLHRQIVPLCGGVAVALAMVAALAIIAGLPHQPLASLLSNQASFIGLCVASAIICIVGVVDDAVQLRGKHKLLGQCLAAIVLVSTGFSINAIELFGWRVELGPVVGFLFSMFWILGAINSLNLIDGVDGLATSVGMILCLTLATMFAFNGNLPSALLSIAMFGSLGGFLFFNFPPGTIFLGDAGSMLIGLIAGSLAIQGSLKGPATVALATPLAIWAIPIFDSFVAILRRKLTGRSIYTTDRGHLHHCMLRRSRTSWQAVSWIGLFCLLTSAGALLSVVSKNELYALLSTAGVLGTLVATGIFGQSEFLLLGRHLFSVFLGGNESRANRRARAVRVHLQGSRDWDQSFERLREAAELMGFLSFRLDVNLPALHESYHGTWRLDEQPVRDLVWRMVLPIVVRERAVGRLELTGLRQADVSIENLASQAAELLESAESEILALAQEKPASKEAARVHYADGAHRPIAEPTRIGRLWSMDA